MLVSQFFNVDSEFQLRIRTLNSEIPTLSVNVYHVHCTDIYLIITSLYLQFQLIQGILV